MSRLELREILAGIVVGDAAVPGSFRRWPDGHLHDRIVVDDQDLRHVRVSLSDTESAYRGRQSSL